MDLDFPYRRIIGIMMHMLMQTGKVNQELVDVHVLKRYLLWKCDDPSQLKLAEMNRSEQFRSRICCFLRGN